MRYKGTIIGLFLLVGLYFVYVTYIQGTENDPLFTSTKVTGIDGTVAGQEIISILEELKDIEIKTSIFQDEQFNSLVDRRTEIIPENVGRNNPFDPIGFGINRQGIIASPNEEVIRAIGGNSSESDIEESNIETESQ